MSSSIKFLILFCATVWVLFFMLAPLHECVHWMAFTIDPYREPVKMEVFNWSAMISKNQFGRVQYREQYLGAWNDEPWWSEYAHEALAYGIESATAIGLGWYIMEPCKGMLKDKVSKKKHHGYTWKFAVAMSVAGLMMLVVAIYRWLV